MKKDIVATVLCLLLAFNLSSATDVAELRRLRALGWVNGSFGGDNGRDHPGMYQTEPVPAPAPVEGEAVTAVESVSSESEVPAPAMQAAESPYSCGGGSFSKGAAIAFGVVLGFLLLVGVALSFCSPKNSHVLTSKQSTSKSVPVPTKDEESLEDMTAASDSASSDIP
jgi:hypothetical protein